MDKTQVICIGIQENFFRTGVKHPERHKGQKIMTQTANTNTMSELDEEINSPTGGGNQGKTFFTLNDANPKATVRFLAYYERGNQIVMHYHFDKDKTKSINVPCNVQFGKDCAWCQLGTAELAARKIELRKVMVFPIYWKEQECQAIFGYTAAGWSPLRHIHKYVRMHQASGIEPTDYDFLLERVVQQKGGAAKTEVMCAMPKAMSEAVKKITPWTVEECREKYITTMNNFERKRLESAAASNPNASLDDVIPTGSDITL